MSPRSPAEPLPEITTEEYRDRVRRVQERMEAERLDALLVTSEDNYRYLTGFDSPTWVNLTRPRYCVVPRVGEPCVIVPSNNLAIVARTSWVEDVRTWVSPCPADDGVTLVLEALRACVGRFERVGAELGPQSRLTMPVGDFLRIRERIAPVEIVDGDWMLRKLRMLKSPAEVAHIRHIAQIVSAAFEALPERIGIGDTEWSVCEALQVDLLRRGAEKIQYLIGTSGHGGYTSLQLGPRQRRLEHGDILVIDTGCSFRGYFCDFNREFSFGSPSEKIRRLYELVWAATEAGIAAVHPGRRACDIWRAQADAIAAGAERAGLDIEHVKAGRMGHSVGLRMCEPPSLHPEDETVLEPGMILTIEPGVSFSKEAKDGPEGKIMVHEENLVVTEDGAELLSRRAPPQMPVVD